jgi:sugar phosphate isomerase/epimerase
MIISLCNEVLRDMDFAEQCSYASAVGYDGMEIAPFTLDAEPHLIPASKRAELRRFAADAGIRITGLHWLLIAPPGLSVTTADNSVRRRTLDVMRGLVELCADLGGNVLIHGSPKQRLLSDDEDREEGIKRAEEVFSEVGLAAEAQGVTYCIEPLSTAETNFINNISEAADLVSRIDIPAFRTMLDTKAAASSETDSIPDLIRKWFPKGVIRHVHVNDRNLQGPGQGDDLFTPVFRGLKEQAYDGVVSVEPFDYVPDGKSAASRAIGYIQGILEAIEG